MENFLYKFKEFLSNEFKLDWKSRERIAQYVRRGVEEVLKDKEKNK